MKERGRSTSHPGQGMPDDTIDQIESGPVVGLPTSAGPLHDDVRRDEVTGRFTALADHPAQQAAFLRLATQREEDRNRLEAMLRALETEMRDRDHKFRNELAARLDSLAAEVREHTEADLELHTELVGRSGQNGKIGTLGVRVDQVEKTLGGRLDQVDDAQAGLATIQNDHGKRLDRDHARIGSLEDSRSVASKVLVAIAGGALGAIVTAVVALTSTSRKSGFDDAERAQVVEAVKANTANLAVIKAVLYTHGLLRVPDGAMPLPSVLPAPDAPDFGGQP